MSALVHGPHTSSPNEKIECDTSNRLETARPGAGGQPARESRRRPPVDSLDLVGFPHFQVHEHRPQLRLYTDVHKNLTRNGGSFSSFRAPHRASCASIVLCFSLDTTAAGLRRCPRPAHCTLRSARAPGCARIACLPCTVQRRALSRRRRRHPDPLRLRLPYDRRGGGRAVPRDARRYRSALLGRSVATRIKTS